MVRSSLLLIRRGGIRPGSARRFSPAGAKRLERRPFDVPECWRARCALAARRCWRDFSLVRGQGSGLLRSYQCVTDLAYLPLHGTVFCLSWVRASRLSVFHYGFRGRLRLQWGAPDESGG